MTGASARALFIAFLPSVLLIGAATFGVSLWLESSGPLWPAILIGFVLSVSIELLDGLSRPGLRYWSRTLPRVSRVVRWCAAVSLLVSVFVLAAQAVIVPFGAYVVWLDLAHSGEASGAVSYVFVLFTAMFAGSTAAALPRRPRLALGLLSSWLLLLASLVLPSQTLFFASSAALVVAFIPYRVFRTRFDTAAVVRSLAVMAVASVLAVGAGSVVEPRGSSFIDGTLAPTLRTLVLNVYPRFPLVADVPGYGYRLESRDLGGRPLLSSAPLYELEGPANTRLYLRSRVFRRYTGHSWEAGIGGATSAGGSSSAGGATSAGGSSSAGDAIVVDDGAIGFDAATAADGAPDISLTVVSDFVAETAHTLDTASIDTTPDQRWEHADLSHGFIASSPMQRGTQIFLFENRYARRQDFYLPAEPDAWLELPGHLPDTVRRLGMRLSAATPAETVSAIRSELIEGAEYTLSPSQADDRDAVAFFLEKREGYCVHFASAFTVLARASGLPARYVTGHLARTDSRGTATISGLQSHAWSEVWFDGQWHVIEATPPMLAAAREDRMRDSVFGLSYGRTLREELAAEQVIIRGDTLTSTQLRAILGELAPGLSREGYALGEHISRVAIPVAILVVGFASALLLRAFIVRAVRRSRRHREAGPLSKELTRVVGANSAAADPRGEGWNAWRRTVGNTAGIGGAELRSAHLDRVILLALMTTFGTRKALPRDRRYLSKVARRLHKRRRK